MRTPSPMVTLPATVTCGLSDVSAPMRTWSRIWQPEAM
jgi:hypothetical protein